MNPVKVQIRENDILTEEFVCLDGWRSKHLEAVIASLSPEEDMAVADATEQDLKTLGLR